MTYMSNADASFADSINSSFSTRTEALIRPGDALTIFVSALDQEAVVPYNLPTVAFAIISLVSLSKIEYSVI